jgi:hypothetical protein
MLLRPRYAGSEGVPCPAFARANPQAFSPRRPATPARSAIRLSGRLHFGLLRRTGPNQQANKFMATNGARMTELPASISGLMYSSGCFSSRAKTLQRKRPPSSRRPYRLGGIASNFGCAAHLLPEVVSANGAILKQTRLAHCDAHHTMPLSSEPSSPLIEPDVRISRIRLSAWLPPGRHTKQGTDRKRHLRGAPSFFASRHSFL